MTISPVSHSNYQNTINIRKNNNLQDNPQIPENQLAFKGLEKVATKTVETQGKKLVPPLATITAIATAVGTTLRGVMNKSKKDKLSDEIKYAEKMIKEIQFETDTPLSLTCALKDGWNNRLTELKAQYEKLK